MQFENLSFVHPGNRERFTPVHAYCITAAAHALLVSCVHGFNETSNVASQFSSLYKFITLLPHRRGMQNPVTGI